MSWSEIDVMSMKGDDDMAIEEHYEVLDGHSKIQFIVVGPDGQIPVSPGILDQELVEEEEEEEEEQVEEEEVIPEEPKKPTKHRRITPEEQERMLELQGQGKSVMQIAKEMSLRRTTVHEVLKRTNQMVKTNILKLRRMQQQKKKKKRSGKKKELLTDDQVDLVNMWLDEDSLLSMAALCDRLKQICGVTVSKSYMAKVIDDFTYSLTRLSPPTIKQDRKLVQARQEYAKLLFDLHLDFSEEEFVFVHFAEYTLVVRTSATAGEVACQRGAKRSLYNAVGCALNKDRVLLYNFQFMAMEAEDYCSFFTRLIECLRQEPGMEKAVIVFDEHALLAAKGEVQRLITDSGYQYLSLPKDSVFLHPVERLFSGWKAVTRRANAKDEKSLVKAIEEADEVLITERDCQNCYASFMSTMIHCYHGKWYNTETTTALNVGLIKE